MTLAGSDEFGEFSSCTVLQCICAKAAWVEHLS